VIEGHPIAVATDLSIDAEFFNWVIGTTQPRVVYFSSSAAYPIAYQNGEHRERLVESDLSLRVIREPDLTYGWAKITGEMLARHVGDRGHEVYVFRPFSGYGDGQDDAYPFPSFIKRIKEKADPFEIWGDGEQVRDFIHIDDIVGAVVTAVELGIQGPVNLGSGVGTSFNELAKMVGAKKVRHLLEKPVGVRYRVSDNSRMLKFYTPKVSLAEGIARALKA
jgi:nucleoside-diphosphate-sugar epimerase